MELSLIKNTSYTVSIALSLVSLGFGSFLYLRPQRAIGLQQKFYYLINWRIEPVSMQKEVRNTKAMGLLLIFVVLASWLYCLLYIS